MALRKPKSRGWLYTLGAYCVFQVAVLTFLDIDLGGAEKQLRPTLLFWFAILILVAAFRRKALSRLWQAWNERGEEVDVEVLPPAPIKSRD